MWERVGVPVVGTLVGMLGVVGVLGIGFWIGVLTRLDKGDEIMVSGDGSQVADRQAALSAGRVVLKLSSADPGTVTLDKVAIHVDQMEKLLGFRQGQLVICFHNGVGEQIAEIHSEQWTLTIKPKTTRIVFELRIRPEAETLLMLREIQQHIEGEDDEGATVVLRPLQSAELMEDEDDEDETEDAEE